MAYGISEIALMKTQFSTCTKCLEKYWSTETATGNFVLSLMPLPLEELLIAAGNSVYPRVKPRVSPIHQIVHRLSPE